MRLTRADIFPLAFYASIWIVGPIIVFALIWQTEPRFRLGAAVTFGSLIIAFSLMMLLESASADGTGKRRFHVLARLFLASAIGVCIGIAMLVACAVLPWPAWAIAATACPLGLVIFILCCVLSD